MIPSLQKLKSVFSHRNPVRLGWHAFKAFLAALKYGFPARKLTVIGITGTDGKTTTSAMVAHILHASGIRGGTVSTSFFRVMDSVTNNPSHKTSISPFALQRFLRDCVRAHCTVAVVECSSHGLVQHRLDWLWPSIAAITNLTPEHLDYHKTMKQYCEDKGILFHKLRGKGTKVLNADDATHDVYARIPSTETISVSSKRALDGRNSGLWAEQIFATEKSVSANIRCSTTPGMWHLTLSIPGNFNVDNALTALAVTQAVGIPYGSAVSSLSNFRGVPGRLERIDEGQPFSVYVDFTVTPASYQQTLSTVKATLKPGKRLLVMMGSCGDRMREKRPLIAGIVTSMADIAVITEDETLTEDPRAVMEDMWKGVKEGSCQTYRIDIRREAMQFLLRHASEGDAVLFCGMGACTTMQTREGLREWDERSITRELLRELLNKPA